MEKTLWKKRGEVFLFLYLYFTSSTKDSKGLIKIREVEKSKNTADRILAELKVEKY